MNDKKISKIIAKKTSLYLRISIILFIVSLILLSTAIIFVYQQYKQLRKDFVDNINTHLITVTRKVRPGLNSTFPLTFEDEKNIKKIIDNNPQSYMYSKYSIGFGISDNNDNVYFVKGIDNQIIKNSDIGEIKDNEAIVSSNIEKQRILLKIPVINVQEGGFISNYTKELKIQCIQNFIFVEPFEELEINPDTIFVNTQTLKKIISLMYNTTWEDYIYNYDKSNPYGIEIIESINVYVDNLQDVKQVANSLQDSSYEVKYVLSAFDDLQGSLNNTYNIYGLLLIFILLTTTINIILSFRGYLINMQKDMGILRHYGYSPKRVYNIYRMTIINPYIKVVLIMSIYILIISLLVLKFDFWKICILTLALILFLIGIILAILLQMLKKICAKEIINLLKKSKEVE